MTTLIQAFTLVSVLLVSALSFAEQKQVFGDYEVHYIGLTSSELDKDAARIYDIPRSRKLGYLSISVLKTGVSEMPVAWDAELSGTMTNLIGQQKTLTFKRIQETNALYFHSTFDFLDENMYKFDIQVKPQGETRVFDLKFNQRFYYGE